MASGSLRGQSVMRETKTRDRNFSSSNQSTLVSEGAQQDKKKQNETFEKLDKASNWQLLKSCKNTFEKNVIRLSDLSTRKEILAN